MYNSISMPEFEEKWKREQLSVVDVREINEWKNGHLDGAIHVPLSNFSAEKNKLDKGQEYYIMCHSGARSSKACQQLSQEGYSEVNIMGGISAWGGEII